MRAHTHTHTHARTHAHAHTRERWWRVRARVWAVVSKPAVMSE